MKKLNSKGFTLIELLAVITIMGILMVVAVPSISRTIENTRKDTFLDTAKQYINGVNTLWISDSLECQKSSGSSGYVPVSGLTSGTYYIKVRSKYSTGASSGGGPGTEYPILLDSGGNSSWANKELKGYIKVYLKTTNGNTKRTYYVRLSDGTHAIIDTSIASTSLKRGHVIDKSLADGRKLTAYLTPADVPAADMNDAGTKTLNDAAPKFCKEV